MTRACHHGHERGAEKIRKVKKPVRLKSVALPPRAETLPGAGSGTNPARRSGAAPNAQDLKTEGGNEPAPPDLATPAPSTTLEQVGSGRSFCSPASPLEGPRTRCSRAAAGGAHRRPGAPLLHFPFPPLRRVGSLLSQTRHRW